MIRLATALTLLLLTAAIAPAQDRKKDAQQTKVKTGQTAPAFRLPDQTGTAVTLKQLLRKHRHVAIVFHRSASW